MVVAGEGPKAGPGGGAGVPMAFGAITRIGIKPRRANPPPGTARSAGRELGTAVGRVTRKKSPRSLGGDCTASAPHSGVEGGGGHQRDGGGFVVRRTGKRESLARPRAGAAAVVVGAGGPTATKLAR